MRATHFLLAVFLSLFLMCRTAMAEDNKSSPPLNRQQINRVVTQLPSDPGNFRVILSIDQIPEVKEPMPVLQLGKVNVAPDAIIRDVLHTVAPTATFKPIGKSGARAVYKNDRLLALINPITGESQVFPEFESLKPGASAEQARAVAQRLMQDKRLFPKDATQAVPLKAINLSGLKHARQGESIAKPSDYLSYVRFQRQVNGIPVYGPGTRAMIAVGADNSIHAFAHRWKSATLSSIKVQPYSRDEIAKAVIAQLAPNTRNGNVRIDKITIAYFDSGKGFIQPVYRFQATLGSPGSERERNSVAVNGRLVGYVSVGKAPEALPVLGLSSGIKPTSAPITESNVLEKAAPIGDPTVGRYVVTNDSGEWVDSANEFMDGLQSGSSFSHIPFTNKQYFWEVPKIYKSAKNNYVNNVHIALTEAHGNWGRFSTDKNLVGDPSAIGLADIPSSGYGGGGGGTLAYWIIHSCEVIPTDTDVSTSFDVWWNIFNGIHAVAGYRTEMWIDDDVMGDFGYYIGIGAPFVPTWINEVASNDSYDDGDTYYDSNRNMNEPMGRASAVVVCGHSDDMVTHVNSLGRASCLTEWWLNN